MVVVVVVTDKLYPGAVDELDELEVDELVLEVELVLDDELVLELELELGLVLEVGLTAGEELELDVRVV